ncbi:MAG TPA: aspartate aminotransferase family protein [Clostridiaceae bacterium]|nr:aspartate aminotransferase family protein [Clostridiaceae bacterium]
MYNLPGEKSKVLWEKDTQYVISGRSNIADSMPLVFERGEGVYIYDVDGNKYLDFSSGILTASTGHCHPYLVEKVKEQVEKLCHVYAFPTPNRYKLCEMLVKRMPEGIDTFAFYCEGGITVEAALRAASSYNKRYLYAAMTNSYHGRTLLTRSLGTSLLPKDFGPTVNVIHLHYPYCYRCPFKLKYPKCGLACIESAHDLIKASSTEKPCAVIFEPIIGAGGIIVPPKNAWKRLAEICREWGMLVIADEVLTGVGRTGKFLAIEHFDVKPDLVTFGKGLGSGIPVMCVAGRKEIMSAYPYGESGGGGSSTSFGGNAVSTTAALATMEIIERENLIENVAKLGEEIKERTADWTEKYKIVGDVRGIGLLWGIELVKDKKTKEPFNEAWTEIYIRCLKNGVRLVPNRICPPLITTSEQLHHGFDVIEDAIRKVDKEFK